MHVIETGVDTYMLIAGNSFLNCLHTWRVWGNPWYVSPYI